jgi:DNA-binding CsgD family transcriptional regulator/tetratricopeptide (TPR) repeat protein
VSQSRVVEALEEAEAHLAASAAAADRVTYGLTVANGRLGLGDLDGAAAAARAALTAAEGIGAVVDGAGALMVLALIDRVAGRFEQGVRHARRGLALVHDTEDPLAHRHPLEVWHALLLVDLDRFDEAEAAVQRGRRAAERAGGAAKLVSFHFAAGSVHWWRGSWDDAIAEYQAGIELAQVTNAGWRMAVYGFLAVTALERDRRDDAEVILAEADAHGARTGRQPQAQRVAWARARYLEACGDGEGAARLMADTWRACHARGIHGDLTVLGPDVVRLAPAHGRREDAVTATAAIEEMAAREAADGIRATALLCRGLLDDDLDTLSAAVARARGQRSPWAGARASELAAGRFAARGETGPARALLDEAAGWYNRLGAQAAERRVDAVARAHGIIRGRRGTRRRPTSGWDSLTPTERRVAELVAAGGSNPTIGEHMGLSRRTVQTHVSHILVKLGLASRVELATAVARRGGT